MAAIGKVGIISCSGEEIPAGTISRLATRRVLEFLRPQATVTLCLPLFLAGDKQERGFAREHPTITVDGCDKLCAKRGTETFSGQVAASLVVTDILGDKVNECHCSAREFSRADEEAVWIVAERIAAEVDSLAASTVPSEAAAGQPSAACSCSCGSPSTEGTLYLNGKTVTVNGLPLIFDHLCRQGLTPSGTFADKLLDTVRIYQEIESSEEPYYREALVKSFCEYYQRRAKEG